MVYVTPPFFCCYDGYLALHSEVYSTGVRTSTQACSVSMCMQTYTVQTYVQHKHTHEYNELMTMIQGKRG